MIGTLRSVGAALASAGMGAVLAFGLPACGGQAEPPGSSSIPQSEETARLSAVCRSVSGSLSPPRRAARTRISQRARRLRAVTVPALGEIAAIAEDATPHRSEREIWLRWVAMVDRAKELYSEALRAYVDGGRGAFATFANRGDETAAAAGQMAGTLGLAECAVALR